jgi:hypothetical protein
VGRGGKPPASCLVPVAYVVCVFVCVLLEFCFTDFIHYKYIRRTAVGANVVEVFALLGCYVALIGS